jgi:hypothetical protein
VLAKLQGLFLSRRDGLPRVAAAFLVSPLGFAGGSGFAQRATYTVAAPYADASQSGGLSRLAGLATLPVSRRGRSATHAGLAGKAGVAGRRAELSFLSARHHVGLARDQQTASAGEPERDRQQQLRRPQK